MLSLIWGNQTCNNKSGSPYTAVSRKVVLQTGKSLRAMLKVVMSNGGFHSCLSEPLTISACWKETAQTRIHFFLFLVALNHLEPHSSKAKLLLPIIPIGIVAYAFTLSWDNLCRNSCSLSIHSCLTVWTD